MEEWLYDYTYEGITCKDFTNKDLTFNDNTYKLFPYKDFTYNINKCKITYNGLYL